MGLKQRSRTAGQHDGPQSHAANSDGGREESDPPPPTGSNPGAASGGSSSKFSPGPLTNFQLLVKMFQFVAPVRWIAVTACLLVGLGVFLEISSVDLTRIVINTVHMSLGARQGRVPHPPAVAAASQHVLAPQQGARVVAAGNWEQLLHGTLGIVLILVGLLGIFVVLSGVCSFFRAVTNTRLSMNMVFHMRATVYDQLQRVGFGFHDRHSSGQLINRALSDLHNIRFFVNMSLVSLAEIVAYVLGYNILVAMINPWAGLVSLLPVPFWLWYIRRFSGKMQPIQKQLMATNDHLVTVYSENVAGVQVVKGFATETTEIGKYNRTADELFGKVMTTVGLWANFVPVIRGIATVSNLALFLVGAILAVHGYLQPGDILVFGMAMGAILSRLQQINQISNQYQTAVVSARRFFEILHATPTIKELPAAPPLPRGPGAVEFSFVTFGYDPAKPVLKDISFAIDGGSVVALVGPTGAGKSTMMQLLTRFYDPQEGVILIDNVDIRKVSLASLRRSIGFVFQETFLFSDTIANNIRYGNSRAGDAAVEAAARLAQAHDFIMEMPRQYKTMLGERGATLSGGQKQRLAIARAIVANPRILVLDDALAAVDSQTEHLIQRALELVLKDRTVFVIAHRLSTVQAADLVIVLENGRIMEAGRHEELMRQHGYYHQIAKLQFPSHQPTLLPGQRPGRGDRSTEAKPC